MAGRAGKRDWLRLACPKMRVSFWLVTRQTRRTLLVKKTHEQVEALRWSFCRLAAKFVEQVCPLRPVAEGSLDSLEAWLAGTEGRVDQRDLDDCRAIGISLCGDDTSERADGPNRCRRVPYADARPGSPSSSYVSFETLRTSRPAALDRKRGKRWKSTAELASSVNAHNVCTLGVVETECDETPCQLSFECE